MKEKLEDDFLFFSPKKSALGKISGDRKTNFFSDFCDISLGSFETKVYLFISE